MTLHKDIILASRHAAHSFEYANAAARIGAVGLVPGDVGKLARQLDTNSFWVLTDHAAPTWIQVSFGTAGVILADGTVAFTGAQSMGGFNLTNLADAVNPQDALTLGQHDAIGLSDRHAAHSFEYADTAARTGAVGLVAGDVGKLARQLDDDSMWILTNHVGPVWVRVSYGTDDVILADGTVPFTGDQSMGGFNLTNLADAVNPQDAFTLAQHDMFADAHVTSGFPNLADDATVVFNEGTRVFTITPIGATFEVWSEGVRHLKAASTITISDVTGEHFLYFNSAGVLVESVNPIASAIRTIIREYGIVAAIYWNATHGHKVWFGDERHGTLMDGDDHYHWHRTVGTVYRSGCSPNAVLSDESGALDTHAQFGVETGAIADEDLPWTLPAKLSTSDWHVIYKEGATGVWRRTAPKTAFPVTTTGTGRMAWNEFTGGAWQLTEATNNTYVLCHLFATNDPDDGFATVVGQAEYGNLAAARAGALVELGGLVTAGMPEAELLWVASFIYQTSNGYANAVKARIRTVDGVADYIDWRTSQITGTAASTTNHSALSGLGNDDHPQYSFTQIQTIAASPYTVLDSDNNKLLLWATAAPLTINLPAIAAEPSGFRVRVMNKAVAGTQITIARAGADDISIAGQTSAAGTIVTTDRDAHVLLESDGVGVWNVGNAGRTWSWDTFTYHFDANIQGGATGHLVTIDANDDIQDSGVALSTVVIGPAAATDNAIARYDLATGKLIQDSLATVDDGGSINIPLGQNYKINSVNLAAADVGAAPTIHNLVDTVNHPVAGLTPGHFMKATGAAAYAFEAHGLTAGDVGAEVPLTFSESVERTVNDVTLVNDALAPGNRYYYGTDATGVKGWFLLPEGGGEDDGMSLYKNTMGDFTAAYSSATQLDLFGLPFNLSASQIKRVSRIPTGGSVAVPKSRGVDLACTWTPDATVEGAGVLAVTAGGFVATDEFIVEIEGHPKGYSTPLNALQVATVNDWKISQDGQLAYLASAGSVTVETSVVVPLVAQGYNAVSLVVVTGNVLSSDGLSVTVDGSNSEAITNSQDITLQALGTTEADVQGSYQTEGVIAYSYIRFNVSLTAAAGNVTVYLNRHRK